MRCFVLQSTGRYRVLDFEGCGATLTLLVGGAVIDLTDTITGLEAVMGVTPDDIIWRLRVELKTLDPSGQALPPDPVRSITTLLANGQTHTAASSVVSWQGQSN